MKYVLIVRSPGFRIDPMPFYSVQISNLISPVRHLKCPTLMNWPVTRFFFFYFLLLLLLLKFTSYCKNNIRILWKGNMYHTMTPAASGKGGYLQLAPVCNMRPKKIRDRIEILWKAWIAFSKNRALFFKILSHYHILLFLGGTFSN